LSSISLVTILVKTSETCWAFENICKEGRGKWLVHARDAENEALDEANE